MSAGDPKDLGGVQKLRRRREYNNVVKSAESELAVWWEAVKQEQLQQQDAVEKNLVLSEMLKTQDRMTAVYKKQQAWIAAGGPGNSLDSPQQQPAHPQQQLRPPPHATGKQGDQPLVPHDAHWVLFLLESATWEQVQQAMSMSCADWLAYQEQYHAQLAGLMEVSKRCPEVQTIMLEELRGKVPQQPIPAIYASSCSVSSSCSISSACRGPSISADGQEGSAHGLMAPDVIVHLLKHTGSLVYVALLHGVPSLYAAAGRNVQTGEVSTAPPLHWVNVAQRMRFSKQQKLHFKLVLQNFARQAREAAEEGLCILQVTPSYAFLLACQAIAARQQSSGEGSPQPPDAATAAAVPPANGHGSSSPNGPLATASQPRAAAASASAFVSASASARTANTAAGGAPRGPRKGSRRRGATASGTSSQPAATAAAAPAPAAGASAVSVGAGEDSRVGSLRVRTDEGSSRSPGVDAGTMEVDGGLDAPSSPTKALQRQMALYYRNVVNLNIFLADTLTLEQALLLNVASYPFWPMLAAVAEAAIQLADSDEGGSEGAGAQLEGVHRLMAGRRRAMQETHYQWWRDYGTAGATVPLN